MTTHEAVLDVLNVLRNEPDKYNPTNPDSDPNSGSACIYTDRFGEHCVAAEVTTRLGGTVPPYTEGDEDNTQVVNRKTLTELTTPGGKFQFDLGVSLDIETIRMLRRVQSEADQGASWHEAIDAVFEDQALYNQAQEDG